MSSYRSVLSFTTVVTLRVSARINHCDRGEATHSASALAAPRPGELPNTANKTLQPCLLPTSTPTPTTQSYFPSLGNTKISPASRPSWILFLLLRTTSYSACRKSLLSRSFYRLNVALPHSKVHTLVALWLAVSCLNPARWKVL
jgi:hypothetical protein